MYHLLINALVITTVDFLHYGLSRVFGSTGLAAAWHLLLRAEETTLHLSNKVTPAKRPRRLNSIAGLLDEFCRILKLWGCLLSPNIVIRSAITNLTWVMYFLLLLH